MMHVCMGDDVVCAWLVVKKSLFVYFGYAGCMLTIAVVAKTSCAQHVLMSACIPAPPYGNNSDIHNDKNENANKNESYRYNYIDECS